MLEASDENLELLNDVAPCVSNFCARFLSPDVSIFSLYKLSVVNLVPKVSLHRGELVLTKPTIRETTTVRWLPSPFHARAPTLLFCSAYCSQPESTPPAQTDDKLERPVVRVRKIARHVVTNGCMQLCGMKLIKTVESTEWNLHWGGRLADEEFSTLMSYQRVNHFPGTWVLGRKDALAKHIRLCGQKKGRGSHFQFSPRTYTWPADRAIILRDAVDRVCFIVKPPAGARGEGISLFCGAIPPFLQELRQRNEEKKSQPLPTPAAAESDDDEEECDDDDSVVVQRYITNPLCVNGYKVDLRVYVVCTSFDPLKLFVYNEGLVRFATEPYPTDDITASLGNIFCHLTNYSINKKSAKFTEAASVDDSSGCKWSLRTLQRYFEDQGWSWDDAWRGVVDIIIKTFVAVEGTICTKIGSVAYRSSCFELYGFDILLDDKRDAHLIEVNVMPSLSCGSALDKFVKGHLVADTLTLVGIPLADKAVAAQRRANEKEARRSGIDPTMDFVEKEHNLKTKPVKFDSKVWEKPKDYFPKSITSDDKCILRDAESELSRCGGFQRVFPTATTSDVYQRWFDHPRHYNVLLGQWEKLKLGLSDVDRAALLRWLNDQGDFPGSVPLKPKRVARTPEIPKKRVVVSRVSSSPRVASTKPVQLPPIEKRSVPVCVFSFVAVPKQA